MENAPYIVAYKKEYPGEIHQDIQLGKYKGVYI
jgi:hypothetical protein